MREILFRGKRKDNGEWVEGNLFIPDLPDTPTQICIGTNTVRISYDVDYSTVGQFTGLTDDKDKKIFEGDIVECYSSDYIGYPKIDTITVKNMTDYNTMVYLNCSNRLVVIGNIHDNPEMLKVGA